MSKIFQNIIKNISRENLNIDEENERLIILDEKNGEFFYEENLTIKAKTFIGRKYSYYVVNFSEFVKINDLNCEISDPKEGITIKLKVSFEISCIKGKAIKALRFFKSSTDAYMNLERSFANWIRQFVTTHPNFTNDYFKLEEKLREFIENEAERKGLRIRITKLNPISNDLSDFPPQHISLIHSTKCEILDDNIEVKNKIILNLFNRRAFSWRNIDDPEIWIKEKADMIIQNELINKSFKEIVNNFDNVIKKNIVTKLEDAIRGIGYSIQHIISVPSKEIAEFLDNFTFDLNNNNRYSTSNAEIKVRLSIRVEAKGTTIKGIDSKYVKPRKSIIKEVEKQSEESVASILRDTAPEDYYTSFDDVSLKIRDKVEKTLFRNFKIDPKDFKIFISFLKTDLKERFDLLFAERGVIIIESQSENTHYEIKYGVQFVNDWHVFHKNHIKYYQKTKQEYSDISEYIKNDVELEFKRLASKQVDIINSRKLDLGIIELFKKAQHIITDEFGLELKSPRLKRVSSSDLDDEEIFIEAYLEKREKLKNELKSALNADDDELVEGITKKLKKIGTGLKEISDSKSASISSNSSNIKKINDSVIDDEENND